jgi:hypothetical protein
MTGLLAELENVGDLDRPTGQVMDAVSIVPEHPEIAGTRGHASDSADGFLRVDLAGRIAVFRHAPHAADRRIAGKPLDDVHVRAARGQGNGDHSYAVCLADGKVPIVAGYRA